MVLQAVPFIAAGESISGYLREWANRDEVWEAVRLRQGRMPKFGFFRPVRAFVRTPPMPRTPRTVAGALSSNLGPKTIQPAFSI